MFAYKSFLFTPGNNARRMEKALSAGADVLIFDLEDAVAVSEKANARNTIAGCLELPRSCKVYVRINGLETNFWHDDLIMAVQHGADGVMLPKAEDDEQIKFIDKFLTELESKQGKSPIDLIPLVESARGVILAFNIACAAKRVSRLAFGALDYTMDIGTSFSGEGTEIFYARSHLVNASRAAGILPPVDTVFPGIKDQDGFERDLLTAKQLGMFGKLLIHPNQIEATNRVFSPSEEEIEWARRVLAAFEAAEAAGQGVVQVDGKMVDYPVADRARRILSQVDRN